MSLSDLHNARADNRHLLIASGRVHRSERLADMLRMVGDVTVINSADIPEKPKPSMSMIVIDIDLQCADSLQHVRSRLLTKSYRSLPRLFVLEHASHHSVAQARALGATETIARPFDASELQECIQALFPAERDGSRSGDKALDCGVSAAHAVMAQIFEKLPAGNPLSLDDVMQAETQIIDAVRKTSLNDWLTAVGRHHNSTFKHCLTVTGFAVAFAQQLGMRRDDQRRLTRGALLHDVGKAFIPLAILDKPGKLTDDETGEMRKHPQIGHDILVAQGGFPSEMLDVVLHHHEYLDGTGYPNGLRAGQISDIVRITTIVDIYAALVEKRAYRMPLTPQVAYGILEDMGGKLDRALLHAFRPVALGT